MRRPLVVLLGGVGAALVVGAFLLARHVGLAALVAAVLVAWLSPVLLIGPAAAYLAAAETDRAPAGADEPER